MRVSMNNGRNWGYRIRSVLLYIRECEMREKKEKRDHKDDEEHDLCTHKYERNGQTLNEWLRGMGQFFLE